MDKGVGTDTVTLDRDVVNSQKQLQMNPKPKMWKCETLQDNIRENIVGVGCSDNFLNRALEVWNTTDKVDPPLTI